jgi:creatinine amidohydrolase
VSIQHLGTMTWREVKDFVQDRVVALVPLGSLVAHGPHLPLNTDIVLSSEMSRRAARKIANAGRDVLIFPPVAYTAAGAGSRFAGTVHVAPEASGSFLRSLLAQIRGMGLRTAALVTCHVDPDHVATVEAAMKSSPKDLRIVCPNLMKEPWVGRMPEEFRRGGAHGGKVETSCMMALHSDKVREEVRKGLKKIDADLVSAIEQGKKSFEEWGGPGAYFGDPASATAAEGEKFLDLLAELVAEAVLGGQS